MLAREIIKAGLTSLDNGENATKIKREIDQATSLVVKELQHNISEDISDEGQLEQIASIWMYYSCLKCSESERCGPNRTE